VLIKGVNLILNDELVRINRCEDAKELCAVIQKVIERHLPHHFFLVGFKPRTFNLELFASKPELEREAERYVREGYRHDIWMKRSPIHPRVTVVKHSEFTSPALLKRTRYYRESLRPVGSLYGVSLVAWQAKTWLSMLTVHRSESQGDFSDGDMEFLRELQPHFATVIRRLARDNEERLRRMSLDVFVKNFPLPFALIDWSMAIVHHNHAATLSCLEFQHGQLTAAHLKPGRSLQLPEEIINAIAALRAEALEKKKGAKAYAVQSMQRTFEPLFQRGFKFRITFVPAADFGINEGLFLVVFEKELGNSQAAPPELSLLTKTEQRVVQALRRGWANKKIATNLGKSLGTVRNQVTGVFRKLGVKNRFELMSRLR
jgi:DNA-binding CsgD family transcriptional regulator